MDLEKTDELLPLLSDAESAAAQSLLRRLLAWQAERYTMGESTSLRRETAEALLDSIRLSLELLAEEGTTFAALLEETTDGLLERGERAVCRRVSRARLAYQRAERCVFQEESISLRETLRSIDGFFRLYDSKFFAAEIPCDIDYQMACPVEETLRGIVYIQAYLRSLTTEDAFLRRFAPESVHRVLSATVPDHRELLVNLYQPVACAALGVTLTEGNLFSMDITSARQRQLTRLLLPLRPAQRRERLDSAAKTLAGRLELGGEGTSYLRKTALMLVPRVEAVLEHGESWQALFPVLS